MYIGYKIPVYRVNKDGSTTVWVVFYKGDIATLDEDDGLGGTIPVSRYRRTAIVKTIEKTVDATYTRDKVVKFLNRELKEEADARGFNVITEQSDV